ncbi:MAG: hypothetical protein RLY93_07475 [Sumerlaeia bacterium]
MSERVDNELNSKNRGAFNSDAMNWDSGGGESCQRGETRYQCNFPGVLKLLAPELSFVPFRMAVQVRNVSTSGAMVEVKTLDIDKRTFPLRGRFFELKLAHSAIPELRGLIAWSGIEEGQSHLGLTYHEPNPEIVNRVANVPMLKDGLPVARSRLPMPVLSPFDSVVREEEAVLRGTAEAATAVEFRRMGEDSGHWRRIPVRSGVFELRLPLPYCGENLFEVRSLHEGISSTILPVVIHRILVDAQQGAGARVRTSQRPDGKHSLKFQLSGGLRPALPLLDEFGRFFKQAEELVFDVTLLSTTPFDAVRAAALEDRAREFRARGSDRKGRPV